MSKKSCKKYKNKKYKYERKDYGTPEYREWVRLVKQRDGNRCQMPGCNKRNFGMEVHHILRYCDHPGLRFSVPNGILLCGGRYGHHAMITGKEMQWAPIFMAIAADNQRKMFAKQKCNGK